MAIILTYLCLDKSSLAFPHRHFQVIHGICVRGTQFPWGLMVLAQIYRDLYNFVSIDKFNVMVEDEGLLQVWAYEKIIVFKMVGLYRDQEKLRDILVTCQILRAYGYMYPHSLEARRREIDGLHAKYLVWVCYTNFVWDDDAH